MYVYRSSCKVPVDFVRFGCHLNILDILPYSTHMSISNQWQCVRTTLQRVKIVINNNIIEQVTDFKYLGYRISEYKRDLEDKLQTYNKIN